MRSTQALATFALAVLAFYPSQHVFASPQQAAEEEDTTRKPAMLHVASTIPQLIPVDDVGRTGWQSRDEGAADPEVPSVLRDANSGSLAPRPVVSREIDSQDESERRVASIPLTSANAGNSTDRLRVTTSDRPASSAAGQSGDLEPPRLLFDQSPIGSGVRQAPSRTIAQRPNQSIPPGSNPRGFSHPPRVSAAPPRPLPSSTHTAQRPIDGRSNQSQSNRSATRGDVAANQAVRLLLSGPNGFSIDREQDFQVVVVNSSDRPTGPLTVVMDPDAAFQITVLDREAQIDTASGAVIWSVNALQAGASETIRFKGKASANGSLVHVLAVLDEATREQYTERFSTDVRPANLRR